MYLRVNNLSDLSTYIKVICHEYFNGGQSDDSHDPSCDGFQDTVTCIRQLVFVLMRDGSEKV